MEGKKQFIIFIFIKEITNLYHPSKEVLGKEALEKVSFLVISNHQ